MRERLGWTVALVALAGAASGCSENPTNCADDPCVSGATCIQQTYETFECVCPAGEGGDGTRFCAPLHTVDGADPASGPIDGGEIITITGSGFADPNAGDTYVRFGSALSDLATVDSDTQITVVLPQGNATGPVELVVVNDLGEVGVEHGFQYFGSYLYVSNGATGGSATGLVSTMFRVNPVTGAHAEMGPILLDGTTEIFITNSTFAPDGTLYASEAINAHFGGPFGDGTGRIRLFTIDLSTLSATNVGYVTDNSGMMPAYYDSLPGLTYRNGVLYSWANGPYDPLAIDPDTAEATVIGAPGLTHWMSAMATDRHGQIWLCGNGPGGNALWRLDPDTGDMTYIGMWSGASNWLSGMAFMDGILYGITPPWSGGSSAPQPTHLVRIDTNTAEVTLLTPLPDNADSIGSTYP